MSNLLLKFGMVEYSFWFIYFDVIKVIIIIIDLLSYITCLSLTPQHNPESVIVEQSALWDIPRLVTPTT